MTFNPNAETVYANGPSLAPNEPSKEQIRALLTQYENAIDAYSSGAGSIAKSTRALLYADLAHVADKTAWVYADSTVAYNGIYRKSGGSGSGSWSWILPLPYDTIIATDAGAGTPNAIVATSSVPVSESSLILLNVFEANTATPVTVVFNGGSALTIKTASGNDVVSGGLVAGMALLGKITGSTFRMVSDQASAAIQAAAEAALVAAEVAQALAVTSLQPIDRTVYPIEKWGVNHLAPDNTAELQLALDSGQPLFAGPHEYIHGPVTYNLCPSLEGSGNATVFSGKAGYTGDLWTFQGGQTEYGVREAPVTVKNLMIVANKHLAAGAQDAVRLKNFAANLDFVNVSIHYAKRFGFYSVGAASDPTSGFSGKFRFMYGSISQCDSIGMALDNIYDAFVVGNEILLNGVADATGGVLLNTCAGCFLIENNVYANNGYGIQMYNSGFTLDKGQIDLNTKEGLIVANTDDTFRGMSVIGTQIAKNSRTVQNAYSDIRISEYANGLSIMGAQLYGGSDNVYDDNGNDVSTQYVILVQSPSLVTRKIPLVGCSITGGFFRSAFSNDLTKFSNDVQNESRITAVESGKISKTIGYSGAGTDTRLLINEGRYAVGENSTTNPTSGTANLPLDLQYSIIDVRRYNDLVVQTAVMPNNTKIYSQTATGIGGTPTWYAWKSATLA